MKDCKEWELEFDRAYDNISSHKAPGLVPYEKSLILSNAQDAVVIGLANGTLGDSFESTESISTFLAPLVEQVILVQETSGERRKIAGEKSHVYKMPEDFLFRTYEECELKSDGICGNSHAVVVPVTQDEFWHTNRNPFKRANDNRVLRLVYAESTKEQVSLNVKHYTELVSQKDIVSYLVRYIRRPNPIILRELKGGLSIHGKTKQMTCELDEAIHQLILTQAVKMAKEAWSN